MGFAEHHSSFRCILAALLIICAASITEAAGVVLSIDSTAVHAGVSSYVRVKISTNVPIAGMLIPIEWDDDNIVVDSVSFIGSIVPSYIGRLTYFDYAASKLVVTLVPSFDLYTFGIPGGTLFRIHYTVPPETPEAFAAIDTCVETSWGFGRHLEVANAQGLSMSAEVVPGGVRSLRWYCGQIDGQVDYWSGTAINLSDVIYLTRWIFGGGPVSLDQNYGDVNCDGIANISDVVYLIVYIFNSGPAPCSGC